MTLTSSGRPLANSPVTVAQKRHGFLFGCTGFESVPLANGEVVGEERETLELLERSGWTLFNVTTLPFYWGRFEPVRGKPDTARLLAAARWFADRGVPTKGHPLLWHTGPPDWLLGLSNEEIVAASAGSHPARRGRLPRPRGYLGRDQRSGDHAGLRPNDNGMTRICRANGRVATIRLAFETAREVEPERLPCAQRLRHVPAFECLIEAVLAAGIKVDALGLQSHMHQGYWGEERTLDVLERFSRYGLPIHFTETTILSGRLMPPEIEDLNDYQVTSWPTTRAGEARQAREVVSIYKTLLSHAAVKAITWWDLPDDRWLHAPCGLVRADVSAKPAFEALESLIKGDWWLPPTVMVTDEQGRVRFSGWLGEYEVERDGGRPAGFSLTAPGEVSLEVALPA